MSDNEKIESNFLSRINYYIYTKHDIWHLVTDIESGQIKITVKQYKTWDRIKHKEIIHNEYQFAISLYYFPNWKKCGGKLPKEWNDNVLKCIYKNEPGLLLLIDDGIKNYAPENMFKKSNYEKCL